MDERLTALEAHFNAILPTLATKADLEALRADIHKWMVATVMGLFIGFAGLFIAMGNILKPTVQPAAAPVVSPQTAPQPAPPVIIYNLSPDSRQPAK